MLSFLWKGAGRAALTYGIAEFFLGKQRMRERVKKIGWGVFTVYLGGKLLVWGVVAALAVLFFQLAGWEFLVKPTGLFALVSLIGGGLLVWQGVTIMKR